MLTIKKEAKISLTISSESIANNAICLVYLYAMISGAPNVFINLRIGFQIMKALYVIICLLCALHFFLKSNYQRGRSRFLWLLPLIPLIYSCAWQELNVSGANTNLLVLLPCIILLVKSCKIDFNSVYKTIMAWSIFCLLVALMAWLLPGIYVDVVASRYGEFPQIYTNLAGRAFKGKIVSIYSNPAGICASIIPALGCSFFAWYYKMPRKKALFAYGLLLVLCLLLTGKRGPLVFAVLALLAVFYVCTNTKAKIFKWFFALLLIALAVSIVVALSDSIQNSDWYIRFSDTVEGIKTGKDITNTRSFLWKYALNQFRDHELFGVGWNQLVKTVPYIDDLGNKLSTHNAYIQLLSETGAIGLVMILLPMLVSLLKTWKKVAVNRHNDLADPEEKIATAFSLFYQLYFVLYCISGNPLYDSIFCIPFLISCIFANSEIDIRGAVIEQI